MSKPTLESFLNDVARHELTIEKDDGIYRHMRLGKPNSSDTHFHITTWPGYLCYSGDMGTFVFSRITDMFAFFRHSEIAINPRYWAEKVEASDRHGGIKEWSEKEATDFVQQALSEYLKDMEDDGGTGDDEASEALEELREGIQALKDAAASEHEFFVAISEWDNELGISFEEWYEHDFTTYTYRYLWCCFAIVWAIQQYDAHKALEGAA